MDLTKTNGRWRGGVAIALGLLGTTVLGVNPVFAGYASVVVDAGTGEILNEVNADQENYPASLTKMMTLYLAFDALKKGRLTWDAELPVSRWAADKSPTKLGLTPGDTVSVHDCVLGMIVLSANDAATVMGEALGGSEQAFAGIMTKKAHELGMNSTTFRNAAGLPDEEQVTTARDLVKLALALYQDFPEQYRYFSTREFNFRGREIEGHNHLMYRYAGMDGLKTGFTAASGFNLAASAVRDNHRLFAVVMGGRSGFARDNLMATLLDNAFAHRETDPVLVAEAAGQSSGRARHLLASLSPIGEADAAPLKAARPPHLSLAEARRLDREDREAAKRMAREEREDAKRSAREERVDTKRLAKAEHADKKRLALEERVDAKRPTLEERLDAKRLAVRDDHEEKVRPARAEPRGEIVPAVQVAHWTVQIGAFAKAGGAEEAARDALRVAAVHGKRPEVVDPDKGDKYYRARIAGFSTEKQAVEACAALKRAGHACTIMPPGKFGVRLAATHS
jgi:D-alanyl-D-alanine carboxypeptidase/D-alanyl-D-alanine carboxypeptidase (penicillin-binding protein 5/6)